MHVAMEITHSSKVHNGETGLQISPNGSGSSYYRGTARTYGVNWSSGECRGVTTVSPHSSGISTVSTGPKSVIIKAFTRIRDDVGKGTLPRRLHWSFEPDEQLRSSIHLWRRNQPRKRRITSSEPKCHLQRIQQLQSRKAASHCLNVYSAPQQGCWTPSPDAGETGQKMRNHRSMSDVRSGRRNQRY